MATEDENKDLTAPSDNYKPPSMISIDELKKLDAEDESLRRYKENLLGVSAQAGNLVFFPNDPRNFILKTVEICTKNGLNHTFDMTGPLDKFRDSPIEMIEGSIYNVKITFFIQREIVPGIRYLQRTSRMLVKVDDNEMLGSYSPRQEPYIWQSPEEQILSGKLNRGVYNITSKFIDDDGHEYIQFKWAIRIVKAPE